MIASIISVFILRSYLKKRQRYHLLWAVGLALWAFSAFAQGYAFIQSWNIPLYKLYYFSAISLSGFLGAGTLGLITKHRVFSIYTAYVIVITVILSIAITVSQVDVSRLNVAAVGGLALPSNVRIFAPFINIPGGITFIGGAAYSFAKSRKIYALLITLGALIPALGGTLARFEIPGLLPFTDFVGILFLALGIELAFKTPVDQKTREKD